MLRIGLALLAAAVIAVAVLVLARPGDPPGGVEATLAPPALAAPGAARLTDQMAAQKVVDAYLSALHELAPKMPDNPKPALKNESERQAYLRGLRSATLNEYLDCAAGAGGAPILDGGAEKPADYAFMGARREGERVRVTVEEQREAPESIEFTLAREGEAWRIDGTSLLESALIPSCR